MGLLGTLLLLFLALHLYDFWLPTKQSVFAGTDHDTYESMIIAFSNPIRVVIYLVGVASLCFHLMHGFQSAFRTFGLAHKKYTPIIVGVGRVFSVVVSILFALMPILIFLGFISN